MANNNQSQEVTMKKDATIVYLKNRCAQPS